MTMFGIAIHGGAGTILKSQMTPEQEAAYLTGLREALLAGYQVLKDGGNSLDAVEASVRVLEDCPLFNAGKGAVFTSDGKNELDASIMEGKTLRAGAVANVRHVKNPVTLARRVMEKTAHVMLVGRGAEAFAEEQGIELMPDAYFFTEWRWQNLQRIKALEENPVLPDALLGDDAHGTVGAVALDLDGNLAAATSTGGMTNKRFGRVGDSPIIGAGVYADNQTCAVSATGHGEYFIRLSVAHDISAAMAYKNLLLKEAAEMAIYTKLAALGGTGGVIAIDRNGHIAMPFNTEGMYRGYWLSGGEAVVKIYKD
jgi:L-asparaginase / beta-aspartyl-peptidase